MGPKRFGVKVVAFTWASVGTWGGSTSVDVGGIYRLRLEGLGVQF